MLQINMLQSDWQIKSTFPLVLLEDTLLSDLIIVFPIKADMILQSKEMLF